MFIYIILGIFITVSVVIAGYAIGMIIVPTAFGAMFVPSRPEAVVRMVSFAQIKPGDRSVDIGSGDGRVVIAMAQAGAEAHGIEVSPLLVWKSRRAIKKAGLQNRAQIHWGAYQRFNFSAFDVVTVFGDKRVMPVLEEKLPQQLKQGSRIIANFFTFKLWKPKQRDRDIYVYVAEP